MAITFIPISTDPSDVLDAVVSCLTDYAEEHGKPSIITGASTYTTQLKRLTLDMASRAFGDDDMGDVIRTYRQADLIAARGHSYTYEEAERLELLADELREQVGVLADAFDLLASQIIGEAA